VGVRETSHLQDVVTDVAEVLLSSLV